MRRINALLDEGENRLALGLARGLKDQVDRGEKMVDDADYDLLGRVVAYFE